MQGEIQIQKQIQLQIHIRCKQLECRAGSLMQEETALAQGRSGGRVYAQELRFPFIDSFCSLQLNETNWITYCSGKSSW